MFKKSFQRYYLDIPFISGPELKRMKTIREDKYFFYKIEDRSRGYRFMLDKHVDGLIIIEKWNGNQWVNFKTFYHRDK